MHRSSAPVNNHERKASCSSSPQREKCSRRELPGSCCPASTRGRLAGRSSRLRSLVGWWAGRAESATESAVNNGRHSPWLIKPPRKVSPAVMAGSMGIGLCSTSRLSELERTVPERRTSPEATEILLEVLPPLSKPKSPLATELAGADDGDGESEDCTVDTVILEVQVVDEWKFTLSPFPLSFQRRRRGGKKKKEPFLRRPSTQWKLGQNQFRSITVPW